MKQKKEFTALDLEDACRAGANWQKKRVLTQFGNLITGIGQLEYPDNFGDLLTNILKDKRGIPRV